MLAIASIFSLSDLTFFGNFLHEYLAWTHSYS